MPTRHDWLLSTLAKLDDDYLRPWTDYPCILWPFSLQGKGWKQGNAYGAVYFEGKLRSSSREAWRFARGEIPNGLHVLHYCNVRRCIRPAHLWLGTTLGSVRDCSAGEANGQAKLTLEQAREARHRLADGESQASIARLLGVHYNTIWKIAHGVTWKTVI
jgi:hypothetical protein